MVLCKLQMVAENETALPGWTGYSVLLKEDVPPRSKVGYLPVISGSPTQLKTVHAVFEKSLSIADELELSGFSADGT